ncbi:MAG TPA: GNAT family N-acetyltransferase [Nitrososphaeraceae archaeon]|jgi:hypothetical protein
MNGWSLKPIIRSLTEQDLLEADRICRLSFGTFLGLPDPMSFYGDADIIATRYRADPPLAIAAEVDAKLVGTNFIANWGSVGVFGPLTIDPFFWDKGIARHLLDKTMEIFEKLHTNHAGLFTFSHSPKHLHLYQKYDFWPRFLTSVMSKPIIPETYNQAKTSEETSIGWSKYSSIQRKEQRAKIKGICTSLTNSIYEGLDLTIEIESVANQKLGDTILLNDIKQGELIGLAICHCGAHTEAGSDNCYVKFGTAVNSEDYSAAENFSRLLESCEFFAACQGLSKLTAGINVGNSGAYKKMISTGFKTDFQGVMMTKNNDPGYHTEEIYAIDDWR